MICPDCGYGYAEYDSRDRKRHRDFHDNEQNGVIAPLFGVEHIIWEGEPATFEMVLRDDIPNARIIVLTPRSPSKLRKVAGQVALIANLETGYTGGVYHHSEPPDPKRDRHLFLYEQYGRFAGLAVFDLRRHVAPTTWEQYHPLRGMRWKETVPFWSVSYWWTHRNHRRKGIATRLVSVATHYLGTRVDQLGVSYPLTDCGEALARALFRNGVRFAR